ncbi:NAD-P-binding protein [Pilatotrama ljubarskyi]|nr:NAD-P-binding protein [Pilatotrama ljubarskyi]
MSPSKISIFLTGATGYIGGSILQRLLRHPNAKNFDITALVRSPEKAKTLQDQFGVHAVIGEHSESDKLTALAEKADVVLSCADSDDLPAMEALFRGIKSRYQKTGVKPILIHTSGTGLITDEAKGMFATDKVYHDSCPEEIESLPDDAFHRNVDLPIVKADGESWVRGFIVLPSTIYGLASGPLFDAGISNRHSAQIPTLIRTSVARGQSGMIGEGKPIWNSVHIDDTADLYLLLIDAALANPDNVPHGREGFYYAENGEHTWYDISKAIARALHEFGVVQSDEPTAFSVAELEKYFGSLDGAYRAFGANSRARAEQARTLGWAPKYSTGDMLASIRPEVEAILTANRAA